MISPAAYMPGINCPFLSSISPDGPTTKPPPVAMTAAATRQPIQPPDRFAAALMEYRIDGSRPNASRRDFAPDS